MKNLNLYIVVPTCNDNFKNGNETDIDCGGSCVSIRQCGDGSACNSASDCLSDGCAAHICQSECSY